MKFDARVAAAVAVASLLALSPASATSPTDSRERGAGQRDRSDLAAFPKARKGQVRHVVRLPALANEENSKIEIIVGRTIRVDCNRHMFSGQVQERTAQGWGYNYYVLDSLGQRASTMMGCSPGTERRDFVRSPDQKLVRYNSRLPLVIYAPENVEVRYRVWRAEEERIVR